MFDYNSVSFFALHSPHTPNIDSLVHVVHVFHFVILTVYKNGVVLKKKVPSIK